MAMNNSSNSRQTNSCTRKLFHLMESLKNPKEFFYILHVKTGSIIPNIVDQFIPFSFQAKFNGCNILFSGELPSIAQQIIQQHPQKILITVYHNIIHNFHFYMALRILPLIPGKKVLGYCTKIH